MKRWILLFGVLAILVGVILYVHHCSHEPERCYAKIHAGMTADDVQNMMGRPSAGFVRPHQVWFFDDIVLLWKPLICLEVDFDSDNRVVEKRLSECSGKPRGPSRVLCRETFVESAE